MSCCRGPFSPQCRDSAIMDAVRRSAASRGAGRSRRGMEQRRGNKEAPWSSCVCSGFPCSTCTCLGCAGLGQTLVPYSDEFQLQRSCFRVAPAENHVSMSAPPCAGGLDRLEEHFGADHSEENLLLPSLLGGTGSRRLCGMFPLAPTARRFPFPRLFKKFELTC